MNPANSQQDPPVTVDIVQVVKIGSEEAFEAVLTKLIQASESFEGHLGSNVFRSSNPENQSEYRIIFKFDSLSNLRNWENSEVRHRLIESVKPFIVGVVNWQIVTGLETWFTLSSKGAIVPPPRYKMLVITFLAAYPTSNLINLLLQLFTWIPSILRTLISVLVLLSSMTYIIMPRLTKLFARWLYPKVKS
ncbi:ABM domain-containing protein [Tumidithrix helvetica PCC 7403]|uniref:antibiotic biosynthesis monooxygenase n=1 Tax=Tumidithrix helvetica TaxID=3457545 RepID=UPI003CBAC63C